MKVKACLILLALWFAGLSMAGQIGTAFTYQGELKRVGGQANGAFDFEFEMFDADTGPGSVAGPLLLANITVVDGVFTVELDFGLGAFAGQERWLEISVKRSSDSSFTLLAPRQKINPAPYAVRSDSALVADGAAMSASADSVPFSGVTGLPAGLADGDDDALSMLACSNGEIAVFSGGNWLCGSSSDGDTLAGLGCSNGQIPVFDGSNWLCGTPSSSYDNVIVVAPSGGDFSSIQAALSSISGAAADNRYLVWVAPGTYSESVLMEQYVDVEGSGQDLTTITAAGSSNSSAGTVRGANDAGLRHVTVVNTGGNTFAIAINNNFNTSPVLRHVTAIASGSANANFGVRNNSGSDATLEHVVSMGTGGLEASGVHNVGSNPQLTDVTATGADGSFRTTGVYNNNSSPIITRVTATASGAASTNYGLRNFANSSPTVTDLTATASGGTDNYAIQNDGAPVTLTRVKATAQGGTDARGIYNDEATVTIIDSVVEASGASSDNYGVYNRAFGGVFETRIDRSTVSGATSSIRNDAEYTTFVSGSRLTGGAVQAFFGTFACVDSHDDIGQELTPACVANSEDGRVKAAVLVNCRDSGSSITRSFSREGSTITISDVSEGRCTIDFGFSLDNRYWTATGVHPSAARIVTCQQFSTDELECFRYDAAGGSSSGLLMLTIH